MAQLKQGLGLIHVFCIASGAMISSGLFILPGLAHAQAGPAVVVSYFLAGLLASIGVLSVAELATAMPKAGGDYFFMQAANELTQRLNVDTEILMKQFIDREQESSTVLSPGLAIPHIIIEGEKKFDILVARVRAGVCFSPEAPQVHAVFILLGTKDERNLHLRALSAIAQIAMKKQFGQRWLTARDTTDIRNMILLSTRRRGVDKECDS